MRSNVDVLPQPNVLVMTADAIETILAKLGHTCEVRVLAIDFVGAIFTVVEAVTLFVRTIATSVQTFVKAERSIAEFVSPRNDTVSEDNQARVFECTIGIDAVR